MERIRKPFQGVANIIRFNWHFYLSALLLVLVLYGITIISGGRYARYLNGSLLLVFIPVVISLVISFYVYDLSKLYTLFWLDAVQVQGRGNIVNINAGFDETSASLHAKYPEAELFVFDFYNPQNHTEVSIRRARKIYPPFPNTKVTSTASIPLQSDFADLICVILSAHEIRDSAERATFFKELCRVMKGAGKIVVVEHLRDIPNFLAYNLGAFHFLPEAAWRNAFNGGNLDVIKRQKITPFITAYTLAKNGTAS